MQRAGESPAGEQMARYEASAASQVACQMSVCDSYIHTLL